MAPGWLSGWFGLAFLFFPVFLARLAETQLLGILQAYLGVIARSVLDFLDMHVEEGVDGKRLKFLWDVLGARVWRLHRAYRFACSPFMAGFMELKHSERRQLKTAGSVVGEKVVKLTQNAIFGRCCMNPDKFRNTNAYVDPAKFERAVGKSSVTNFELQINDLEGFLAFVETLKTDRSKACMSVPTQVGARTLQLSKLFPKMRLLFTDTDSVMVQIFKLQDPLHAIPKANLNGALFDVAGKSKDPERDLSALSAAARAMGQLGKLGDETFPARILEYVGLRSKMYSILTVQPDGARKEKRKIKGVPKKAVTNVRHLEYWEEEGSGAGRPSRSCAAARTRSPWRPSRRSRSPFNDKVYGLDAHKQLRMLRAYAPPGSAPFDLVMELLVGPPPLGPAPALPLRLSRCWARLSEPKKKKIPSSCFLAYFDPMLKEMTSSAAFRCVQAWLVEKPATGRSREDALLEAQRSHQRARIAGLNEELLDEMLRAWSGSAKTEISACG